ncbi:MAG TPA: NAD-binding protein, partial [Anaerolineales bacterium]|nr:NAD-binding protein [Anaerolineales bacterium]
MNIIVVGCGRVGAELAYRLYKRGNQVTVIDYQSSAFNNLPGDFRGRTIQGEVLNQQVLHRAGIEKADGMALVTSSDTVNAVVAHAAKAVYGINNIIVRNYDPRWRSLYELFGTQVVS